MRMHWLTCGAGKLHIIGSCPRCSLSQGGLLVGTVACTYKGVTTAKCADCAKTVDYYVDADRQLILHLEAVKVKKGRIP